MSAIATNWNKIAQLSLAVICLVLTPPTLMIIIHSVAVQVMIIYLLSLLLLGLTISSLLMRPESRKVPGLLLEVLCIVVAGWCMSMGAAWSYLNL